MSHLQSITSALPYRVRKPDVIIKEICDHSRRFGNPYVFISALRANVSTNGNHVPHEQDENDAHMMREQFVRSIPKDLINAWNYLLMKDGVRIVRDASYKQTLEHVTDDQLIQFYLLIAFLDIDPEYGHAQWQTNECDFEDSATNAITNGDDDTSSLQQRTIAKQEHALMVIDKSLKRGSAKISQIEQWYIDYMGVHRLEDILKEANGNLPRAMARIQNLLGIYFDIPQKDFDAYVLYFSSIVSLEGLTHENVMREINLLPNPPPKPQPVK